MEYAREELLDAERQIESTIQKLEATVITFESKDNVSRCKSQITLGPRKREEHITAQAQQNNTIVRTTQKIGRNDPCPCGSGKKYKKCCRDKDLAAERGQQTN